MTLLKHKVRKANANIAKSQETTTGATRTNYEVLDEAVRKEEKEKIEDAAKKGKEGKRAAKSA